jgi:iron(III) transport system permease protein
MGASIEVRDTVAVITLDNPPVNGLGLQTRRGIAAGIVTSFATAAVELSATLMLVQTNADAPLAYGIYLFMQSPAGRGAGAALGVIAVVIVGIATYAAHVISERDRAQKAGT